MEGPLIMGASTGLLLGTVETIGLAVAIVKKDEIRHDTKKGEAKLENFMAGIVECKRGSSGITAEVKTLRHGYYPKDSSPVI